MFGGLDQFKPVNFWHSNQVLVPHAPYTTQSPYAVPGPQHAFNPITLGSTVIGIKFDKGCLIAADTMVSYGNMARFTDVDRVFKLNDMTILGFSGDYSDFQFIQRQINSILFEDHFNDIITPPNHLYAWLTTLLYGRRSRMNPLYVNIVIGGITNNDTPFLGRIDVRGNAVDAAAVATGLGQHLALPLIREHFHNTRMRTTERQALEVLQKCMEIIYYRDCRSIPRYKIAICTNKKTEVIGPCYVDENWSIAKMVIGYQ